MNRLKEEYQSKVEREHKRHKEKVKAYEETYRRFESVDFGIYNPTLLPNGIFIIVEENKLQEAIRHFRKQFNKAGKVESVNHMWEGTFRVSYCPTEDFDIDFYTNDPEKYLDKGCRIEKVTKEEYEISCEVQNE